LTAVIHRYLRVCHATNGSLRAGRAVQGIPIVAEEDGALALASDKVQGEDHGTPF
jgi:hypothetical protein